MHQTYAPAAKSSGARGASATPGGWTAYLPRSRGRRARLAAGLLVGLFFLLALPALGPPNPYQIDEGFYIYSGWHMLRTGDWLVPEFLYEHLVFAPAMHEFRYQKPILFYWLVAGAYEVFGTELWAARLPSHLFAAASAFLLLPMARLLYGERTRAGLLAIAFYLSSFLVFEYARAAMTDMPNMFFGWLSALFFLRYYFAGWSRWDAVLAWVAAGIAGMTKGPPGPLFSLGVVIPYLIAMEWRAPRNILRFFYLPGPLLFLALYFWWPLLMQARFGAEFWTVLNELEYAGRVANPVANFFNHLVQKSYPYMWIPYAFPASLAFIALLFQKPARREILAGGGPRRANAFLLFWMIAPVGAAMLTWLYKPNYLIPALIPFALLTARLIEQSLDDGRFARRRLPRWIFAGAALLLAGLLAAATLLILLAWPAFEAWPVETNAAALWYLLLPAAGFAVFASFYYRRRYYAALLALAPALVATYVSVVWALPGAVSPRPEAKLAAHIAELPPEIQTAGMGFDMFQGPWLQVPPDRPYGIAETREGPDGRPIASPAQFTIVFTRPALEFAAKKLDSAEPWVIAYTDSSTRKSGIPIPAPPGYYVLAEYSSWRDAPFKLALQSIGAEEIPEAPPESMKRFLLLGNRAAAERLGRPDAPRINPNDAQSDSSFH